LPVHYGGNPSDIIKIKNICKNKSIKIIEDAATAIGAKIGNKYVGSLNTDASVYSLYGNKVIVSGEGGIISAKNSKLEKKIRKIIFCGMDYSPFKRVNNKKENWKYNVTIPGYKYNMSDIQSSIALAQFSKIEKIISKRKIISDVYSNNFSELNKNNLAKPIKILKNNSSSHYIYTLLINTESLKISRNDLINYLKLKNIDTTVHYIPAHKHKFYSKMFKKFKLPNCNYVFDRIISLPMHENLSKHQINYVSNNVIKFIKQNTKKNFY
jgi:perosamine synthetase